LEDVGLRLDFIEVRFGLLDLDVEDTLVPWLDDDRVDEGEVVPLESIT
jgi:hypothetical protein